ncbi:autophagy-related protein 13 homolog [Drosophila nasuta]|uniref:autophagy-related protein 13 homolog n=1 Tax=Drosophila nasuta TaxID=42062 RepID=UPI00295F3C37|nr:autophagy-related protein 13 homolog [Drosophila nasuta]
MSTQRLNAAEKDLEKFIKFLALKSTQVVVQSRLGEKIQTQCNPLAGNDWFNIVVQDHPDVLDETKRALSLKPGDSIMQRLPLCIEISLKTSEGDQMILEVWSLDLLPLDNNKAGGTEDTGNKGENENQVLKASHAIYNRMGIMLKSLISLTRTTPAYKLSRRQCPDSYGIFYRIYVDRPQVHTLGEGHKHVKIGQLNTIVGSLIMSVAYRTKLTISPTAGHHQTTTITTGTTTTAQQGTIMLKSDHFRPASDANSPTSQLSSFKPPTLGGIGGANGFEKVDKRHIDIEKPLRPGAFTDLGKLRQFTEHDFVLPETPPFEWLLRCNRQDSIESLHRKCESPVSNNNININNNNGSNGNLNHNNNILNINNNSAAFKSFEKVQVATSPIKSLLIPASRHNSAPTLQPQQQQQQSQPAQQQQPTTSSDDDSLLKELHFPFASPTSHVNDLAKFYRECYHAPPLRGLGELQAPSTVATSCGATAAATAAATASATAAAAAAAAAAIDGSMDDLSRQLEQFETSLEDYDKLVSQFGLSGSSSTGSRSSGGLQMSN